MDWCKGFLDDLKFAFNPKIKMFTGVGIGLNFRLECINKSLRSLAPRRIKGAFESSA